MKNIVCLVILFCLPLIYCNPCSSEQPQVSNEESKRIEKLKQGQMPIPKDSEVKKSPPLTQGASLQTEYKEATISIKDNPVKGNRDAKLVLIEFLDYQWPFCARYVRETYPLIEKEYIETGKIQYVAKDFPLEVVHKSAPKLAQAALCGGDQGKYWEMRNFLFANQNSIKIEDLPNHAMELGLDKHTFTQCLDTGKYTSHLSNEIVKAKKAGVVAPTFFLLGFVESDGKVKAARIIEGTRPYAVFKEAIDALLTTIK